METHFFVAVCVIRQTGTDDNPRMTRDIEFMNVIEGSIFQNCAYAYKIEEKTSLLLRAARMLFEK